MRSPPLARMTRSATRSSVSACSLTLHSAGKGSKDLADGEQPGRAPGLARLRRPGDFGREFLLPRGWEIRRLQIHPRRAVAAEPDDRRRDLRIGRQQALDLRTEEGVAFRRVRIPQPKARGRLAGGRGCHALHLESRGLRQQLHGCGQVCPSCGIDAGWDLVGILKAKARKVLVHERTCGANTSRFADPRSGG